MKKVLLYFFILSGFYSCLFSSVIVNANDIANFFEDLGDSFNPKKVTQQDMIVGEKNTSLLNLGSSDEVNLDIGQGEEITVASLLKSAQNYILGLLALITISMFIFIGIRLAMAEGKSEEFSKAMKALLYVVVGLAIIPISYIAIKIVTGFNF